MSKAESSSSQNTLKWQSKCVEPPAKSSPPRMAKRAGPGLSLDFARFCHPYLAEKSHFAPANSYPKPRQPPASAKVQAKPRQPPAAGQMREPWDRPGLAG